MVELNISQNFLNNIALLREILDKSNIGKSDVVLDIGAGTGVIAKEVSKIAKRVYAIEYDKELEQVLRANLDRVENVQIVMADFLKYTLPENSPYKVFSNIPFSITSDIINKLIFAKNPPEDSFLFVQKEAAMRYLGIGEGTMLSLLILPFFDAEVIYEFSKNDFTPRPSVDIVLLRLTKRTHPLVKSENIEEYRNFIVYALWQQKTSLKLRLGKIFTYAQFHRLSKDQHFDIDAKSTDLTPDQWANVFKYYLIGVENDKKEIVNEVGEDYFRTKHKTHGPSRTKIRK